MRCMGCWILPPLVRKLNRVVSVQDEARDINLNRLCGSIVNFAIQYCPPRNGINGITIVAQALIQSIVITVYGCQEECRAWRSGAREVHSKIKAFGGWLLEKPPRGVCNFFRFDDDKSGHMDIDELKAAIIEWQRTVREELQCES